MSHRLLIALAAVAASLLLPAAASAGRAPQYYVSLGDSYASGYQPTTGNSTAGFAYQVPRYAKARGYRLTLVNFGCGGATTRSLLRQKGCPKVALGPGAPTTLRRRRSRPPRASSAHTGPTCGS